MPEISHLRHKPLTPLDQPRELVLALPPLRSQVNLSRIARAASCCGVTRMIACGNPKLDPKIARDAVQTIRLESRRTLPPVLRGLKQEGYVLVALEQTTNSQCIFDFRFPRRTALVIGHERLGVDEESLRVIDAAIEIPVYGLPYSFNVATAAAMAMYEYCRQFPRG